MIALRGVRSSWDMLARNSLFRRLASMTRVFCASNSAPCWRNLLQAALLGEVAEAHRAAHDGSSLVNQRPVTHAQDQTVRRPRRPHAQLPVVVTLAVDGAAHRRLGKGHASVAVEGVQTERRVPIPKHVVVGPCPENLFGGLVEDDQLAVAVAHRNALPQARQDGLQERCLMPLAALRGHEQGLRGLQVDLAKQPHATIDVALSALQGL